MSEVCAICLEDFGKIDIYYSYIPTLTLPCNHTFHEKCIKAWVEKVGRFICPMCKDGEDERPLSLTEDSLLFLSSDEERTCRYSLSTPIKILLYILGLGLVVLGFSLLAIEHDW